jgi:hypothetical protein
VPNDPVTVIVNIDDDTIPKDEKKMPAEPIDLPSNVAAAFLVESVSSATQVAKDARTAASAAMNNVTSGMGLAHVLLGVSATGRAVSGINATDLGGPVNQVKPV